MICPQCGGINPDSASFCNICGSRLQSAPDPGIQAAGAAGFSGASFQNPSGNAYGGSQVLFHTDGGVRPRKTGSAFYFVTVAFGVIVVLLMISLALLIPSSEQAVLIVVLAFILFLANIPALIMGVIRVNMAKRIRSGRLDVSRDLVEGFASTAFNNGLDYFVNPTMVRIPIHQILSAGQTIDGSMLMVRTMRQDYYFATPCAQQAASIIMDQVRLLRAAGRPQTGEFSGF